MTRINISIDPRELCDQHLIAEYHEIQRLPHYARKRKAEIPLHPTLGKGHISYFLDKRRWVLARFRSLCREMERRKFKNDPNVSFDDLADTGAILFYQECCIQPKLRERIKSRLPQKPRWTMPAKRPEWV